MEFALDGATRILARTPATLHALLDGLPDEWTRADEGPNTFSPFDVIGHLIDGEETDWIPRARIILAQGTDTRLEPYDRLRHRHRSAGRALAPLLTEFAELRAANLQVLHTWRVEPDTLALAGVHPSLGRVTLSQLLATWVAHDLGHIAQISRVLAKQYRDAVGPWIQFLPVLTDHETPRS